MKKPVIQGIKDKKLFSPSQQYLTFPLFFCHFIYPALPFIRNVVENMTVIVKTTYLKKVNNVLLQNNLTQTSRQHARGYLKNQK